MNHLGQRRQTVGSARCIRYHIRTSIILGVVHTDNIHWRIIGGCRDDNLLGPTAQMGLGLVRGSKDTGRFTNVGGPDRSPGNVRWILLIKELDYGSSLAIVNDERVRGHVGGDGAGIFAMDRVVLEEVGGVVEGEEGVVDGDGHDIAGMFEGGAADETADATEAVDSDFHSHGGWMIEEMDC